jgi:ribonuclease M5
MANKMRLICPLVVEGKYDKIRLSNLVETPILVLNGFSVFKDKEKKALLQRICKEKGLIFLTDSDHAGNFLRTKLKGIFSEGKLYHVYTPQISGKEKRKNAPSAEGLLGVEGMDHEILRPLLAPYEETALRSSGVEITSAQWYADGFSGGEGASQKRKALAKALNLPDNLSSGALLEAVNLLCDRETYEKVRETV